MSQPRRRRTRIPCLRLLAAVVVTLSSTIGGSQAFVVVPHHAAAPAGGWPGDVRCKSATTNLAKIAKPSAVVFAANSDDAATTVIGGSGGTSSGGTSTCRNCKQQFRREDNGPDACSFHPGLYSGRLNRVNDVDTSGLEYFWSCCGEPDKSHPGCVTSSHKSYDDPAEGGDGAWRSPLTSTLR